MKNLIYLLVLILIFSSCKKDEKNTLPFASFEVYPSCKGTVTTEFTFDASASYDEQSSIEYRWDLDGDYKWDTDFSINPLFKTTYPKEGTYCVTLEVIDNEGWTEQDQRILTIFKDPLDLVAVFSFTPSSGDTCTIFLFDASASYDPNNPGFSVKVCWDFEGDGIWDTGFFEEKTAYHRYVIPGEYFPSLQVKSGNITKVVSDTLVIN